jgi:hypothetical protein
VTASRGTKAKILVAEDKYLFAEIVCDFLRECDLEPIGPVGRVDKVGGLARERPLDGALLDTVRAQHLLPQQ